MCQELSKRLMEIAESKAIELGLKLL